MLIDLSKFVQFTACHFERRWRVVDGSGKFRERVGREVGTVCLRHASGYEVVLEFDGGVLHSFAPHALLPATQG